MNTQVPTKQYAIIIGLIIFAIILAWILYEFVIKDPLNKYTGKENKFNIDGDLIMQVNSIYDKA